MKFFSCFSVQTFVLSEFPKITYNLILSVTDDDFAIAGICAFEYLLDTCYTHPENSVLLMI